MKGGCYGNHRRKNKIPQVWVAEFALVGQPQQDLSWSPSLPQQPQYGGNTGVAQPGGWDLDVITAGGDMVRAKAVSWAVEQAERSLSFEVPTELLFLTDFVCNNPQNLWPKQGLKDHNNYLRMFDSGHVEASPGLCLRWKSGAQIGAPTVSFEAEGI